MPKQAFAALLVLSMLVLAGCGQLQEAGSSGRDILFLRSNRGLTVIAAGAEAPSFHAAAVPSRDWTTVIRSSFDRRGTRVWAVDPSAGEVTWEQHLGGRLMVKLTAEEADMVALAPIRERHFSVGRRHTRLTIAGRSLSEPKSILLKGNYEPEAFSTDRKSLFVIRFLPARAPTRYQVRRLDIEEGRVHAVYTPDADLQESMGGTARIQTASPDGSRLYTLYTTGTGNDRYAFIHVLSLDEIWAHCIDLPPEFAKHADTATSISVSPDGRRLYVVNAAAGMMAEVDTSTLEVVKTAPIDFVVAAHVHSAVDDSGSTVFFTSGNSVAAVNTMDLTVRASWEMDQKVQGVQVAVDGARVYVGLVDRIVVLDAASGKQLESIDPPGIKRIQEFGPVIRSIDQAGIVCAC
ncbi:MAG: hypothetical protein QOG54_2322 [Actinomycetota bacterium]|nr:hypothetical protein [Actinomycetota bacterium]